MKVSIIGSGVSGICAAIRLKSKGFDVEVYEKNKMPKVTMLTGKKGQGKQTLINHFLSYVFDNKNYDLENRIKELELKFSKDPSEATFNELKNEKKKQNIN